MLADLHEPCSPLCEWDKWTAPALCECDPDMFVYTELKEHPKLCSVVGLFPFWSMCWTFNQEFIVKDWYPIVVTRLFLSHVLLETFCVTFQWCESRHGYYFLCFDHLLLKLSVVWCYNVIGTVCMVWESRPSLELLSVII